MKHKRTIILRERISDGKKKKIPETLAYFCIIMYCLCVPSSQKKSYSNLKNYYYFCIPLPDYYFILTYSLNFITKCMNEIVLFYTVLY